MSLTVPPLVFRIPKGVPLTAVEGDANLTTIRDFLNALAALYGISFNNNGTIKNDSISTAMILDRAVTQRKLDWVANFFSVASGTNTYTATINPTAGFSLGDGATTSFFAPIKFTNANTGPSTLNINGAGATPLKKFGNVDLAAGDISAGAIHVVYFDGTNFQIPTITSQGTLTSVYALNTTDASNMDISFTKPAAATWKDLELDFVGEGLNGVNFKIDFLYQTAPEVGNAPATGAAVGTGNAGQAFRLGDSGEYNTGKWMYRGKVVASLVSTTTFTVRAAKTVTGGTTFNNGQFMGRATYL